MTRNERIAAIKQQIDSGTYQVNVAGIVDGMMQRFANLYPDPADIEDILPAVPTRTLPPFTSFDERDE